MAGLLVSDAELERRVLLSPTVVRAVGEVLRTAELEATDLASLRAHDTGQFAVGIRIVVEPGPNRRVRASGGRSPTPKPKLPIWLERGTGIYGPSGKPITPKNGKYLVFRGKGARQSAGLPSRGPGALVFVKSVKGRPASHIMRDAGRNTARRLGLRWVESR